MKKILSIALVLCLGLGIASVGFAETFGLGIVTEIASSTDADAANEKDGLAQVNSTIVAVVLDDAGVIVDIKVDVAQTKVNFSPEGAITTDKAAEIRSKIELREDYNMKRVSAIEKELYEQLWGFEAYCVGKPAADVINMSTSDQNGHVGVADDPDLKAVCSISIGDILAALAKAVDTAAAR